MTYLRALLNLIRILPTCFFGVAGLYLFLGGTAVHRVLMEVGDFLMVPGWIENMLRIVLLFIVGYFLSHRGFARNLWIGVLHTVQLVFYLAFAGLIVALALRPFIPDLGPQPQLTDLSGFLVVSFYLLILILFYLGWYLLRHVTHERYLLNVSSAYHTLGMFASLLLGASLGFLIDSAGLWFVAEGLPGEESGWWLLTSLFVLSFSAVIVAYRELQLWALLLLSFTSAVILALL